STLLPGTPLALASDGNNAFLIKPPDDISPFTHPVLQENGSLVYIDDKGDLILTNAGATLHFKVNALPDARILMDELGRLLFLSSPTSDYPHAVLGDALEARSITRIDPNSNPENIKEIQIDPADVIEGIAPLWVDLDGDGKREIIVTQSNIHVGARIVVYNQEGEVIAQSDPIGQGFRWLHLIAAAQFVNEDTLDLVVVRTPHIGGVLEIYELTEGKLEMNTSVKGYSSHQIGSRNLDASLITDVNADGIPDIVLPDQSQQYLSALQITDAEWTEIWRVPLNEKLTTNLMGVYSPNSGLVLGAGTEGNKLMLWVLKD
ncbi:MAG: VCBS repeat-containing protein, partial [Anaerolineaceae bacterium]|nr:VCBS repeat-containing protein [Anaerolineaceae bacterium]